MKSLLTAVVAAAALWAAACGSGGGATITPPPPAGNYKLASLNGTYAFVTSGEVIAGTTETPLARVGSFIADGKGNITSGVEDVNAAGTVSPASTITGGNYTVSANGRGTLSLKVVSGGFTSTINFAIVLTSASNGLSPASDGLMIDETSNASQASTGSGNFVKQDTTSFATTTVNGTYVFDFSGLDSGRAPASIVGEFAASSGALTGGLEDENDNFQLASSAPIVSANFTSDPQNPSTLSSSGRGLVTINGEIYAFYIVNVGDVRFISIGSAGTASPDMLTGDAVLQSTPPTTLSGGFAFVVAGSSANGGLPVGLTRVARFTASGGTLNNMLMDVNDAGSETQRTPLSNGTISTYDPTTGRGMLSFQDPTLTYTFVFYLSSASSGVIQDVSPSGTAGFARVVADGSMAAQSGSPFTSTNVSGTYALNWSGLETAGGNISVTDEEDLLAQLSVSSLALSGTADLFQFSSPTLIPQFDVGLGGQIAINGNGTGDDGQRVNMDVNLSDASPIHFVVYFVNPQLAFFANRDNNGAVRIVAGILKAQQ